MVHIPGAWITVNRLITRDDGTIDAHALTAVCLAFKDGRVDHRDVMIIVRGQRLFPNLRQLYPYIFPARNVILMRKEFADNLRLAWNRAPPCCADAIDGANPSSRPSQQLPPAPEAMLIREMTSERDRAEAAREKPPNVIQLSAVVQRAVQQNGYWASKLRIQKLAVCRLGPGGARGKSKSQTTFELFRSCQIEKSGSCNASVLRCENQDTSCNTLGDR
jgi:hypothetical protein